MKVTLEPGQSRSETFDAIPARAAAAWCRCASTSRTTSPPTTPRTSSCPPRRTLKILLVSDGNLFLERGAERRRPRRARRGDGGRVRLGEVPGGYDVTSSTPARSPGEGPAAGRYLFWGGKASGKEARSPRPAPTATGRRILDWNRTHPLMRFVDLANVHLRRQQAVAPVAWGTTLAETDAGPLIVAGEKGATRAVYVPSRCSTPTCRCASPSRSF
jgi:hypothetical protein